MEIDEKLIRGLVFLGSVKNFCLFVLNFFGGEMYVL